MRIWSYSAEKWGRLMEKLLTDIFTRRTAQYGVMLIFILLTAAPLLLLMLAAASALTWLDATSKDAAFAYLQVLALPIQDSGAQIGSTLVATFPAVVAAVCFFPSHVEGTTKASTDLNRLGKGVVICILIGAVASLCSVVLLGVRPALVQDITDVTAFTPSPVELGVLIKGVLGGLLAFDLLYLTTLLGIQNAK